ncbi:MAG: C1 family peptidase, partial [Syntrophomonas sp.]
MSFEIVYQFRRLLENLQQEHNGYQLRCIPSPYDPRDYKYLDLISTAADESVPIDYRSKLPPVFDQGQRGSCVACASTWTLKAYEEIKQGDYPQDGLSASFLYTMCKQNDGIPFAEGTQLKTAMQVLQKNGVCPEDTMPYSTLTELPAPLVPEVPAAASEAAVTFRIKTYAQLCSSYDTERSQVIETMRQALKNEGPFIIALLVCENFEPDENYLLPLPEGQVRGGHAVGIAGDLPEKKCLILRNSWGAGWGDKGYAYLPYEWITSKINKDWALFEAWTATDFTPSQPAARIEINPGVNFMKVDGKRVSLEKPISFNKV